MIEAEEVKQSGVVVVMADGVLYGFVSELVSLTVNVTGFEPASGDPHSEAVGVVVSTDHVSISVMFDDRKAPHFTAPVDDGGIEESARFEVDDESGGSTVDVFTGGGESGDDGFVVVPGLVCGEELNESNPAFDEASCEKAACPKLGSGRVVESVEPLGCLRLGADV